MNATFATSGCCDEPLADDPARPDDDVQHALRQPGLERDLLELDRGQRRQLGRLEHDRVAGRERRRDLPRGDREREVPRARSARRRRAARETSCRRRRPRGSCRRAAARARPRSSGRCSATMPTSPRASLIGLPTLRDSSRARSSSALGDRVARSSAGVGAIARRDVAPGRERGLRLARPPRRRPRRSRAAARPGSSSVAGSTTFNIVSVLVATSAPPARSGCRCKWSERTVLMHRRPPERQARGLDFAPTLPCYKDQDEAPKSERTPRDERAR